MCPKITPEDLREHMNEWREKRQQKMAARLQLHSGVSRTVSAMVLGAPVNKHNLVQLPTPPSMKCYYGRRSISVSNLENLKKSLPYGDVNFRGQSGYSSNYGYRNNGAVGDDVRRGYGYPHHPQQQPRNPHYNQHDYRGPHNHSSRVDQRQSFAPNSNGRYGNQYQPSSAYRSYNAQSSSNYNKGIRTNTGSAPTGSKTQQRKSLLPTHGGSSQQRKSLLPMPVNSSSKSTESSIQPPESSAVPQKVEAPKPKEPKCVTFSDESTKKPQTCEQVSDASLSVASDVNNSEEVNSELNSTFTIEEENNDKDPLCQSESSKTIDEGQVQCSEETSSLPLSSVRLSNNDEPNIISEEITINAKQPMDSVEGELLGSVITQIEELVNSQPHRSEIIETPVLEVLAAENVESEKDECELELVYPESPETFHEANESISVDEPEGGNMTENKDNIVVPIVVTAPEDISEECISTETLNTSDPEQKTVFSTPQPSNTPPPQIEDDLVDKLDDLCITPMKSGKKPRALVDSTNIIESSTIEYVVREVKKNETVDLVVTPVRRSTRIKRGAEVTDAGELPSENMENVSYLHPTRTMELLTKPKRHSTAVLTSPDAILAMKNSKVVPNPYLN